MNRVPSELDIENPEALLAYLRAVGRLRPGEAAVCRPLAGGVSNRTVLVERAGQPAWVLKQALAKLRVREDWFSDPARNHREALGLKWLRELAPLRCIPALVFEDPERFLLAMEAVPQPHENWKEQLLKGAVDPGLVDQFGALLGRVHEQSRLRRGELAPIFDDRTFFESLRLEPYYRAVAVRHPGLAGWLDRLISETMATRLSVVHGDYSPKNVLIHQGRLVLLDHEVIHFGDPAFDVGFALTHLLSKALHVRTARAAFLDAAGRFHEHYAAESPGIEMSPGFRSRAVRHTLACLLARVDGRSPLEYLRATEQARQRDVALALLADPPRALPELIDFWGRSLAADGSDG